LSELKNILKCLTTVPCLGQAGCLQRDGKSAHEQMNGRCYTAAPLSTKVCIKFPLFFRKVLKVDAISGEISSFEPVKGREIKYINKCYAGFWFVFKARQWEHIVYV